MAETVVEYHYYNSDPSHHYNYLGAKVREILLAEAPPPCRVLDLGCGNGFSANQLSELGYEVIGVDSSESGIEIARKAYPKVKFVVDSAYNDLAAKYGRFQAVTSLEVIEHCYDPRKFAERLYEVLEPGGLGIISTPYHGYLKNLALALTGDLDKHFTALWDGGHIKFFSIRTLSILLREKGFEQLKFYRVGRIPPLAKSMIAVGYRPKHKTSLEGYFG
jgi:2-polyprenyl-3-methyl-5-hydroxy-6-metoxy-1,4-benzoquinol methylase